MLGECPQRREVLVFCHEFQEQKFDKSIVLKLKELIIVNILYVFINRRNKT
jgi:hypothetical protein